VTTIALTTPSTPTASVRPGRAGFRQAVAAEWTKLFSLRSTKWILAITALGTLLVTVLSTESAVHKSHMWYQGFDPTNQSLAGLSIGALALGTLGVLMISGEYGTGTIRSSLSALGRRDTLFLAKLAVLSAVTLVVGEVLSFGAYFLGHAILSGGGAPVASLGQPGVLRAVVLSGAFLSLFSLLGFGLGMMLRHTAGALATFAGVTLLAPILLQTIGGHPARFTPAAIFANSVAAVVPQSHQLSATIGFMLMALYCTGVLVAGAVLLTKRDA
jgi:ABC-type transport system involved in multi-copper enzyme maturation permease subunit